LKRKPGEDAEHGDQLSSCGNARDKNRGKVKFGPANEAEVSGLQCSSRERQSTPNGTQGLGSASGFERFRVTIPTSLVLTTIADRIGRATNSLVMLFTDSSQRHEGRNVELSLAHYLGFSPSSGLVEFNAIGGGNSLERSFGLRRRRGETQRIWGDLQATPISLQRGKRSDATWRIRVRSTPCGAVGGGL